jgi:SAM-dependent methyltransferase
MDNEFGKYNQYHGRTNFDNNIFDYLLKEFSVKNMIDIGCGPGGIVNLAISRGIDACGVDGDPYIPNIYDKPYFKLHDYTKGGYEPESKDLAWMFEFLEHVYEKYIPNIFTTLSKCKIVFCTHAFPGQKGTHHVNCQTDEYWIKVFEEYKFTFDSCRSYKLREVANNKFSKKSSLLFVNNMFFKV